MRLLILLTIFFSCDDQMTNDPYDKYSESDLASDVKILQNSFKTNSIPTSDDITEFLDDKLYGPTAKNCITRGIEPPSKTAGEITYVSEEEEEEEEITEDESIDSKLKKNFSKLGGTPVALDQALCFFNKNKNVTFNQKLGGKYKGSTKIKNHDYMVIQDFTLNGNKKRFFLLNLITGEVETMYSSLGFGTSGPNSKGLNPEAKSRYFSNDRGSYLTPRGFMVTSDKKVNSPTGKAWEWIMQYDGIQKGLNDNSRDRAIIFHQAVKSDDKNVVRVTPGLSSSNEESPELQLRNKKGKLSEYYNPGHYSNGCTTVSPVHAEYVYEKTKGRSLTYNFTHHEKELGKSYCGDQSMVKND